VAAVICREEKVGFWALAGGTIYPDHKVPLVDLFAAVPAPIISRAAVTVRMTIRFTLIIS